jgi:hypothetical protein
MRNLARVRKRERITKHPRLAKDEMGASGGSMSGNDGRLAVAIPCPVECKSAESRPCCVSASLVSKMAKFASFRQR